MSRIITKTFVLFVVIFLNAEILLSDQIKVGTAHFPPFRIVENGEISGRDYDVVKAVLDSMGENAEYHASPWKRAYDKAVKGDIQILFSFTKNQERERHFYFSDSISTVRDVFFKRKDQEINWQDFSDLKGKKIGLSSGYRYGLSFMKWVKSTSNRVEALHGKTPEIQNLSMLARNRTDLFICEVSVCQYLIEKDPVKFGNLDFHPKSIGKIRGFHVGFSKKWDRAQEFQVRFNHALKKYKADRLTGWISKN